MRFHQRQLEIVHSQRETLGASAFCHPHFEENQKEQLGCLRGIRRRHLKDVTFPHFEENQKKPEGCF